MSDNDPYVYPGTSVLQNKFDIHDAAALRIMERRLVQARIEEGAPLGKFDLPHLQAIHHHLFQDVYDWAGEVRTCPLHKGGSAFQPPGYIYTGMADVSRRLEKSDYLKGLSSEAFAARAGEIIGDVNHVHPFREGNGRTQLIYLDQLADQAGHKLSLTRLDPELWIEASKVAHQGHYTPMAQQIRSTMQDHAPALQQEPEPEQFVSVPPLDQEL